MTEKLFLEGLMQRIQPNWYLLNGAWHHCVSSCGFSYVDGVRQNGIVDKSIGTKSTSVFDGVIEDVATSKVSIHF